MTKEMIVEEFNRIAKRYSTKQKMYIEYSETMWDTVAAVIQHLDFNSGITITDELYELAAELRLTFKKIAENDAKYIRRLHHMYLKADK